MDVIGKSVYRKDSLEKVTGRAKYTGDESNAEFLYVQLLMSTYAHALIKEIDTSEALQVPGVHAVVTGSDALPLTGEEIRDRPPLAVHKVRYHGEIVALVVADEEYIARKALPLIKVTYEPLPIVNSPTEALSKNSPLLHENLANYKRINGVYPEPNTNIAHRTKIRKGNLEKGWSESEVIVEGKYSFSPSSHAAMETRSAIAEIKPDGTILIKSSSQAPFMIKKFMSQYFNLDIGKIVVETPLVGGAYGGKGSIQWEIYAYLASRAVRGRRVKLIYTREEDLLTAPCHIGLDATVKIGCTNEGIIKATEILYLFDGGAYSDKAADVVRAGAVDCTGPYHIENIWCDSLCMYTNHPYAAPFRGFGHSEVLFAFERTMDLLAEKLSMDPLKLREINAISPGDTTPTQVLLNESNVGNVRECIKVLKEIMNWQDGQIKEIDERRMIVKGVSCIWKTSTIDPDASSGVILTFNRDGSINLMSGVVEIGTGTKTVLAQILAERFKMSVDKIHVRMTVDTMTTPEHWKTVASRGTFMGGRAVLAAAEDAIQQIKNIAACVLRATPDDLIVGYGRVFLRDDPKTGLDIKDVAYGYQFPNGNSIGGQILARGHYILREMTKLDAETGKGKPGPEWTVGAEGVEVEFDKRDYTYRILKAFAVIDIGKVLNEKAALGQVMGAMSMGIAFAGRETFIFDRLGRNHNYQLRTYRPLHYGENPEYIVRFVETPQLDAPYGARGVGEHGLIGMPAALANALSLAVGAPLNQLPLVPELIWRTKEGTVHDSF